MTLFIIFNDIFLLGILEYKCTGTILGRTWQLGSGGHHKDISYEFGNNKNKSFQGDLKNEIANVTASNKIVIPIDKYQTETMLTDKIIGRLFKFYLYCTLILNS